MIFSKTYALDVDQIADLNSARATRTLRVIADTISPAETEAPSDGAGVWVSAAHVPVALRRGYRYYKHGESIFFRRTPGGITEFLLRKRSAAQH